jgi:hypothetical protein
MNVHHPMYGLIAEFDSADRLVEAARKTRDAGYIRIDALSPFALSELNDALRLPPNRVPLIFLIGGISGGLLGFLMQVYSCVYSYPINVGGRPLYSWPAFIPITFELTILSAGLCGAFGMLIANGLPQHHHPLFNSPQFDLASQNRFFLLIESGDSNFQLDKTREFLSSLGPISVGEVPR